VPENVPSLARLVVVQGDASRREVPLERSATIGRGEESELVLLDGACSRRHAQIVRLGGVHVLRDLGSTNGTFVNGKRVREARLSDGDEIAIGGVRIRFRSAIAGETFVVGGAPTASAAAAGPAPAPTGRSAAILAARALAERAASSSLPVLLRGETGTGKEVFARYIHARGLRAGGPFVPLHAASVPPSLFEAELFGHERGAFTGADARRDGFLARASSGTLFLDEVGELPPEAQVKLLRVLETGEFYPVGSSTLRRSDFRLIAATNRDLERAVPEGSFRSDLLFRLNALQIQLPPLRERREDLPLLIEELLRPTGKTAAPALLEAVSERSWPGNLRELRNALERAALMAAGDVIGPEDLPLPSVDTMAATTLPGSPLSMDDAERNAIAHAMAATGGKRGEAARLLGISEPTLRRKLRRYGLGER
jgi:two-component system, NtrC family, response regulator AtoC